jgi:hypothetical protein
MPYAPSQTDDPVLLSADVAKKQDTVSRVAQPILSKPLPPPPKKEEPAVVSRVGRQRQQLGEE